MTGKKKSYSSKNISEINMQIYKIWFSIHFIVVIFSHLCQRIFGQYTQHIKLLFVKQVYMFPN